MGAEDDAAAASAAASSSSEATIHIRSSNGSKFTVDAPLDVTVAALKVLVAGRCDVPADQQRLIYKGRVLKDEQTLLSYGLESDHTIHLVRGITAPTPSTNTTTTTTTTTTPNISPSMPRDNVSGSFGDASIFPGLGGAGAFGLFGNGLPEFDQMHQQLSQNPNIMREVLNMPMFQNLMNNPEILRNMIMNNPQMREILDRNPDLAHILNDPSTLRQTLEAARNPELMREMMRNTDRAMSNIESSPEGFNMLRRMYETVQEPFLNATTAAGDSGTDTGSNPFAALLVNSGAAQPAANSISPSEGSGGSPAPNTNPLPNPWNNTGSTRPPATGARTPNNSGLGSLGLFPGLESLSGMGDPSQINQILQNPPMQQAMQALLSDPQSLNQLLNFNPQTRSLLEPNTQLRNLLQNPEFLQRLSSPETFQQLMTLNQSLGSIFGGRNTSQEQDQTGGGTGNINNADMDLFINMLSGLGAGSFTVPRNPDVPPEELYATQLAQLQEMGFFDTQENIRVLTSTAGNVHAAVERLLGNIG